MPPQSGAQEPLFPWGQARNKMGLELEDSEPVLRRKKPMIFPKSLQDPTNEKQSATITMS